MFFIKSEKIDYGINLPSEVSELTVPVLEAITSHIKLAPYYGVICIAQQTTLFEFASNIRNAKGTNARVIPLIAKVNIPEADANKYNLKVGEHAVIPASSLEHGLSVFVPIAATGGSLTGYFQRDEIENFSKSLRTLCTTKKYTGNLDHHGVEDYTAKDIEEDNTCNIVVLDFKIVPLNMIQGALPNKIRIDDPFYVKDITLN